MLVTESLSAPTSLPFVHPYVHRPAKAELVARRVESLSIPQGPQGMAGRSAPVSLFIRLTAFPAFSASLLRRNLERMDIEQVDSPDLVEALLFLASYHRNQGNLQEAERHATRLLDFAGPVRGGQTGPSYELSVGNAYAVHSVLSGNPSVGCTCVCNAL